MTKDAERLIALLREYTEKLTVFGQQAKRISEAFHSSRSESQRQRLVFEYHSEHERFNKLLPITQDLARLTSQQIEYGVLDEMTKIEFMLRLAELEGAGRAADSLMTTYIPMP
jgi:hypothetical protein